MPCPIVWFEAVGQHADKLSNFYGEVLGWRFEPKPVRKQLEPRIAGGAGVVRDAAPDLPAEPPWWVTFYTRVPDLDAAIATARSLGGKVLVAPRRHGGSLLAVVSDPEGHPLGLCT